MTFFFYRTKKKERISPKRLQKMSVIHLHQNYSLNLKKKSSYIQIKAPSNEENMSMEKLKIYFFQFPIRKTDLICFKQWETAANKLRQHKTIIALVIV